MFGLFRLLLSGRYSGPPILFHLLGILHLRLEHVLGFQPQNFQLVLPQRLGLLQIPPLDLLLHIEELLLHRFKHFPKVLGPGCRGLLLDLQEVAPKPLNVIQGLDNHVEEATRFVVILQPPQMLIAFHMVWQDPRNGSI